MTTSPAGLHVLRPPSINGGVPQKPKPALCHEAIVALPHVVGTQSNVRREVMKKPDRTIPVFSVTDVLELIVTAARGKYRTTENEDILRCWIVTDQVICVHGRTNNLDLAMLPREGWPKWCRTCGGSGLKYCSRCLGTGKYRYIMGFKFMKLDANENDGSTGYPGEEENTHRQQ